MTTATPGHDNDETGLETCTRLEPQVCLFFSFFSLYFDQLTVILQRLTVMKSEMAQTMA